MLIYCKIKKKKIRIFGLYTNFLCLCPGMIIHVFANYKN